MAYDEIVQKRKGVSIIEHLIGVQESFQLDQFSEGEIYLKEIRFGSKQQKKEILTLDTSTEEEK